MHLMIGYGSPLRCDDRLGQYLAETLGQDWNVLTVTQLTPELAEPISRAERVVFLDAFLEETPGTVVTHVVEAETAGAAFTHQATPASLLASAQELYGNVPLAILITVAAASFEYSLDFSPQIMAVLPKIERQVRQIISTFLITEAAIETTGET
jgi:hydrogenase maturation protease